MNKKLVIFSAFYEPYMSGAEQMVKEIAEKLGEKYDLTVITGRYDKANKVREQRENFLLLRVGVGHKQIDKLLYPFCAAFKAKKIKPDIAHAIMESYAGGALVIFKKIYSRAKTILTLQSGDLDDDVKQKKFLIRFFWKMIHKAPEKVTAISTFLARRAERIRGDKIEITPNGLYFDKVPQGVEKKEEQVICVGRLSWEKAHKDTLNAWLRVKKEFPAAKLVFVGEGPERGNIEKQINDLGLTDSVTLTGNVPHDEVLRKMSESVVFICPSLAEGLGNVFIEAQACGVPPIGTRVGGIPDVIQHEENGLLIDPGSPDQIADAITRLLKDKELRDRLSGKALETSRKFEWNKILEKIEKVYEE